MQTLRQKLLESSRFLVASELVSVRGSMAESSAIKVRNFANELIANPDIDWISITDNAGGNPQLAPLALGRPILYAGKAITNKRYFFGTFARTLEFSLLYNTRTKPLN